MSTRAVKRKSSVLPKASKAKKGALVDNAVAKLHLKRDEGSILVFGNGDCGQLGLGLDVLEKSRPAAITELNDIIEVAAGGMHTVCITSDYKVKTFGCNDEGALGRDTSEEGSEAKPGEVDLPGKVVQVSAGDSHTSALLETGEVYVWGTFRDTHGSMGLIHKDIEKKPILLESKVKFTKVVSGSHHLVLLGVNKQVYTCGCGEQGQLGRLSLRTSSRDSRQGLSQLRNPSIVPLKGRLEALDIWAGLYCTFILDSKNNIQVFGLNNYKQLGVDAEGICFHPVVASSFSNQDWKMISGGEHHTIALDSEGSVYTLGRKEYGRLGLGADCEDAVKPTKVQIPDNAKCIDATCGSFASFAVTDDGKLYSWGMGSSQLGVGDEDDKVLPTLVTGKQLENKIVTQVAAGAQHTAILVRQKTS